MIVYILKCENKHKFESWFKDSESYDKQVDAGLIECPSCGSQKVKKAVMAPSIARKDSLNVNKEALGKIPKEQLVKYALKELRQRVESQSDYVGKNFAEEIRKIHNGETEDRNIYGEATPEEAEELMEEGIEFGVLPDIPLLDA